MIFSTGGSPIEIIKQYIKNRAGDKTASLTPPSFFKVIEEECVGHDGSKSLLKETDSLFGKHTIKTIRFKMKPEYTKRAPNPRI